MCNPTRKPTDGTVPIRFGNYNIRNGQKVGCEAVEKCDAAAVSAWRIRCDDFVAGQPAGVDAICEFCLLEDAQVHIGLGHPPECRLQPPLPAVAYVIGAESNRHRPIRRLPGRVAYTLPPM